MVVYVGYRKNQSGHCLLSGKSKRTGELIFFWTLFLVSGTVPGTGSWLPYKVQTINSGTMLTIFDSVIVYS
jgi:hypothetical protein